MCDCVVGWVMCIGERWCGMVYGVVWCGMVWYGVWCGMVYGVVWCGMVWYGVWCGRVYGAVWCGVVWYGVWCGGVLCSAVAIGGLYVVVADDTTHLSYHFYVCLRSILTVLSRRTQYHSFNSHCVECVQ